MFLINANVQKNMNIRIFIPNPHGPGVIVDNATIFGMSPKQFLSLSKVEREFVVWYTNRPLDEDALITILVESDEKDEDRTLNIPQQYLCMLFLKGIQMTSN